MSQARDLKRYLDNTAVGEQGALVLSKPTLRCEVAYRGRTKNGHLRHASFKGLRDD